MTRSLPTSWITFAAEQILALPSVAALFEPEGRGVPASPFWDLQGLTLAALKTTRPIPAAERRLLVPNFVETFCWQTVCPLLPLRLVVPPGSPPWRPRRCRSHYQWVPPDDIHRPADWEGLDAFDLVLRLFDFSAWRPLLGQRFKSQFGPPPFDPVSLGLIWLLMTWRNWSWTQVLTELHSAERGQGYCRRLGLEPDDLPRESTLRVALTRTRPDWLVACEVSLALALMAYGLLPTHSTFPGESPARGVSVAIDCQLVDSRSRRRCAQQNARCFGPRAQRACAARAKGKEGCACDTPECADYCRLATPRDPDARFVIYQGHNQSDASAAPAAQTSSAAPRVPHGKPRFGFKAKTLNVLDDRLFTYWSLSGPYVSANRNDHLSTKPAFEVLQRWFPGLVIGEVCGDAGEGYPKILRYVYKRLHALRTIKLRAAETDENPLTCLKRGYDAQGVPVCPHGYRLAFNGHDYERQTSKWVCRQRCTHCAQPDIVLPRPAGSAPATVESARQEASHAEEKDTGPAAGQDGDGDLHDLSVSDGGAAAGLRGDSRSATAGR